MIAETQKNISQLVEINRALAHDLDVSRRVIAELGRDRETQCQHAVGPTVGTGIEVPGKLTEELRRENARLKRELAEEQRLSQTIRREMEVVLGDAEMAWERARYSEEQNGTLLAHFQRLEQERDDAVLQLEESTAAMDEIRHRLFTLPEEVSPRWLE